MKTVARLCIIVIWIVVAGLVGCQQATPEAPESPVATSASPEVLSQWQLLLSPANIKFQEGQSKIGHIVSLDEGKQEVTVRFANDQEEIVPMAEIEKIIFRGDLPQSKSLPVIRGTESWTVLPLSEFKIIDAEKGMAEVNSEAIQPDEGVKSCRDRECQYLVREMWFNSADSELKLRLKVTLMDE